jgi:SOS-response transcriptional repressor LexA
MIDTTQLEPPTPRQREVLVWLADYVDRHGYGPTIREGAAAFGMRSPHGFHAHVLALIRKGWLVDHGRKVRSVRVAGGVSIEER